MDMDASEVAVVRKAPTDPRAVGSELRVDEQDRPFPQPAGEDAPLGDGALHDGGAPRSTDVPRSGDAPFEANKGASSSSDLSQDDLSPDDPSRSDPAPGDPSPGGLSPDVLAAAIDAVPDCVVLVEHDGAISYVNATGRAALEVDDAVLGAPWHDIWPEAGRGDAIAALQAAAEGRRSRVEIARSTTGGRPRWWDVSTAPMKADSSVDAPDDASARTVIAPRAVVVLRDVTERVQRENSLRLQEMEARARAEEARAEEERAALRQQGLDADADAVLMREADHRMKNSLALVAALLTLEGRKVTDERARDTLKAASARIATIASVHEQLYRGTRRGALELAPYLERLAVDLVHAVSTDDVRVDVRADDVTVAGNRAMTLGLVLVELVLNALRHAGFSAMTAQGGGARLEVACRRIGAHMLRLTVRDNGHGLPPGFDPTRGEGLGMRVVGSSVEKLEGRLNWRNEGGAVFEVTFAG